MRIVSAVLVASLFAVPVVSSDAFAASKAPKEVKVKAPRPTTLRQAAGASAGRVGKLAGHVLHDGKWYVAAPLIVAGGALAVSGVAGIVTADAMSGSYFNPGAAEATGRFGLDVLNAARGVAPEVLGAAGAAGAAYVGAPVLRYTAGKAAQKWVNGGAQADILVGGAMFGASVLLGQPSPTATYSFAAGTAGSNAARWGMKGIAKL